MQCSSCGGEVSPTAKFCRSCGAKVDVSTRISPSPTPLSDVSSGGEEGGESFYCGKCGTQNSTANDFCVNCGVKLHPALVEVSTETAPSTSPTVKGKSGSNRTKYLAVFIILILIVAALFGSGLGQQLLSGTHLPLLSQPTSATSTVTNLSGSTASTNQVSAGTSTFTYTSGSTLVSGQVSVSTSPSSVFASAPTPPTTVGCHVYSGGAWKNVECASPEALKKQGHLAAPQPSGICVVGSGCIGIIGSQKITYSIMMVNFIQYGSEQDINGCEDGSYGPQLNTNLFKATNSDEGIVQFVYQHWPNACGGSSPDRLSMQLWDITTGNVDIVGYWPADSDIAGLSSSFSAILEAYVSNGNLVLNAFLGNNDANKGAGSGEYLNLVTSDVLGLANGWVLSTGGILGSGGGSRAEFRDTVLQTDIGVASCPNPQHLDLWHNCGGTPMSASYEAAGTYGATAESTNLVQTEPLLTKYFSGTHWWLSWLGSIGYGCTANPPPAACSKFFDYGAFFGLRNVMGFTVDVNPTGSSVKAGYDATAVVNVTSIDGVQPGPIAVNVAGMDQGGGVGTVNLNPAQCSFSSFTPYLQPGSTCKLSMQISTNTAAKPGSYPLSIMGSPPSNVVDSDDRSGIHSQVGTSYSLTIQAAAAPSVVIYLPTSGSSYPEYQPVLLIGYAAQSIQGQFAGSFLSCNQLQFQAAGQKATPTPDPQYSGYCDAEMTFSLSGSVQIALTAINNQGIQGTAKVTINIVPPTGSSGTQFTFALTASPQDSAITVGGSSSHITVHITCLTACSSPQTVHLQVSGLPSQAKYSFDVNSPTPNPTSTVTLTITAPYGTPTGTYTVKITGTPSGGGTPQTATIQLTVQTIG